MCTDPAHDSCGCGAVWDDCETPGTTCLAAGCDYAGACVTPAQMYAVCNDDATPPCFECPFCPEGGSELCLSPPPSSCSSQTTIKKYTQQWLGCGEGGACVFAFGTEWCDDGEVCVAATCVPDVGCGPVPAPAAGTWEVASVTAELPGYGEVLLEGECAQPGFDQHLDPLTIQANGNFSGQLFTDYLDTWLGCLQPHVGASWAMVLQSCDVTCYGNELEAGKLGIVSLEDGMLVVRRTGSAGLDADGVDCQGGLQWFNSVPLTIRYSLP